MSNSTHIENKRHFFKFLIDWFSLRKSMYFVLIKDIYFCKEEKEIMIKYQCANKRLGGKISVQEFMNTPLKHATHPDQIFYIGAEMEKFLQYHSKNKLISSESIENVRRLKKVFYSQGDNI